MYSIPHPIPPCTLACHPSTWPTPFAAGFTTCALYPEPSFSSPLQRQAGFATYVPRELWDNVDVFSDPYKWVLPTSPHSTAQHL